MYGYLLGRQACWRCCTSQLYRGPVSGYGQTESPSVCPAPLDVQVAQSKLTLKGSAIFGRADFSGTPSPTPWFL